MATAHTLARLANWTLKPLGMRVERSVTPWDKRFSRWVREAEASGTDPNDIGDEEWGSDLLCEGLANHYLPFVAESSVVVELGPGSGRLSRHLIGRCAELVVADSSTPVCTWIERYLRGKGSYKVHRITGSAIPQVPNDGVDCIFAHGVFEHLDFDECYWFFLDFRRILKPGGLVAFNYDTLQSDDAAEMLHRYGSPTQRSVFRLHHPDALEQLARLAGFARVDHFPTGGRIAFARLHL